MATLEPVLDSFLIYDPERSRSACTVFVPPVSLADHDRLGQLFIVAELLPNRPGQAERLRALQEVIANAYYRLEDHGLELSLEHALSVANGWIQERVRREEEPWLPGLACFVGALRDTFIAFTRVGDIQGLLMRGPRVQPLAPRTAAETVNPLKVFSTTWSGTLQPSDTLLIATTSLLDYFSQEKLRRTVSQVPPAESAADLDSALRDNPTGTAFATLIIQLQPMTVPSAAGRTTLLPRPPDALGPQSSPQSSIEALNAKERSTHELLQPSLWRSVTLLASSVAARAEDAVRTRLLRKPARRRYVPGRERSLRPSSLFATALLALWSLVKRCLTLLFVLLIAGSGALIRLFRRTPTYAGRQEPWSRRTARTLSGLRELPRHQQLALAAVVVAALALVVGGVVASTRRGAPARVDRAALAASIKDQTAQLENVLSYGDEAGARTLLKNIDDLIGQHPAKRQADREAVDGFRSAVAGSRDKVSRVVRPTFTTHADLAGQGRGAPVALVRLGRSLYAVTDAGGVIDATTQGKPSAFDAPPQSLAVRSALGDGTTLLLWTGDGLTRVSPRDESYAAVTVSLPAEPAALATFQSRLYVADKATDQILRFPRAENGYGAGVAWLKDRTVHPRDAAALAVDGAAYLAGADNVSELLQGMKQPLSLDTLDPPLSGITQLWTDEVSPRLYLLSPSTNRLVVFSERGVLVAQYVDSRFHDARGFAIDESKKLGYVLTGTTVERFPLTN